MYGGPKNDTGARGYLFKKVDGAGIVVLPEKKEQNTGHLLIQAEQTGYGLLWLSTEMTGQVDSKTKQMYNLIQ